MQPLRLLHILHCSGNDPKKPLLMAIKGHISSSCCCCSLWLCNKGEDNARFNPKILKRKVGEIISWFEKKGFKLKGLKLFECPKELAEVCGVGGVS